LEQVASRCREKGAEVLTYAADVSHAEAVDRAAQDFLRAVGRIDLVIANAGVAVPDKDRELPSLEAAITNMNINYYGVINTLIPFIGRMKVQKSGSLAVISSISALRATHNSGAYSASKVAVNLWTEGLRLGLRPFGIGVTTLCVGFVDTSMTRSNKFWMPGLISAAKASALIEHAIERRKRLAVLPWTSGGLWMFLHLLPGRLYDRLIDAAKHR
jgi:short-subunit dehydrogenase